MSLALEVPNGERTIEVLEEADRGDCVERAKGEESDRCYSNKSRSWFPALRRPESQRSDQPADQSEEHVGPTRHQDFERALRGAAPAALAPGGGFRADQDERQPTTRAQEKTGAGLALCLRFFRRRHVLGLAAEAGAATFPLLPHFQNVDENRDDLATFFGATATIR